MNFSVKKNAIFLRQKDIVVFLLISPPISDSDTLESFQVRRHRRT